MTPISCSWVANQGAEVKSDTTYCYFLFSGNTYAIPLFNQFGYSAYEPSYCACEDGNGGPGPGATNDFCNIFNLMAGFLLFDYSNYTDDDAANPLLDFQIKTGYRPASPLAYTAMYYSAASGWVDTYDNATARAEAYEFCNLGYQECSILTFSMLDAANRAISDYYYELLNGSCHDSITIAPEEINLLKTTPPTTLSQTYYECHKSRAAAIGDAFGTTVGTVTAMIPLIFLFMVNLYMFMNRSDGSHAVLTTYTRAEREDALQGLAVQLLMMRDGRLSGVRKGTVGGKDTDPNDRSRSTSTTRTTAPNLHTASTSALKNLTDELMENAYISTYFAPGKDKVETGRESTNPLQSIGKDDIELGSISATLSRQKLKQYNILNESSNVNLEVVESYNKSVDEHGAYSRESVLTLIRIVEKITKRMLATTNDPNCVETFWDVAIETAVLKYLDLEEFLIVAQCDPELLKVYGNLVVKLYQLFQMHIR